MQAMDTAPRDGTEVLLQVERRAGVSGKFLVGHWMPGGHCIEDHPPIDAGWYFWNGCMFDRASKPVGWHPLPPVALHGDDIAQSAGSKPIAKLDPEVLRLARKVGAAVLERGLYTADFDSEEDVKAGNDCGDDARQLLNLLKALD